MSALRKLIKSLFDKDSESTQSYVDPKVVSSIDSAAASGTFMLGLLDESIWDLTDPVGGPKLISTPQHLFRDNPAAYSLGVEELLSITRKHPSSIPSPHHILNIKILVRNHSDADIALRNWMQALGNAPYPYMQRLLLSSSVICRAFPEEVKLVSERCSVWTLSCDMVKVPEF